MMDQYREIAGTKYEVARGPEGLKDVLTRLLKDLSKESQYIFYTIGNQESLIRVELAKQPYQIYYNDKLGRPAPELVKKTIAECMEKLS